MFIAALLTIAKIRKQPKCPSTDDWIQKKWYRRFPGGPVAKTLCSQCRGPGFSPGLGLRIVLRTYNSQNNFEKDIVEGLMLIRERDSTCCN